LINARLGIEWHWPFCFQGSGAMTTGRLSGRDVFRYGVLAGAAGGLAEMIWVSIYSAATGGDATLLARGVTTAVGMSALLPSAPVMTGISVHMALAVLLGVALTGLSQSVIGLRSSAASLYALSLVALAAVWAMNFLVVLPAISPTFVNLVPYSASLISKLLFGLAAAETLRCYAMPALITQPRRVT
jgi:hypothetical protein